MTTTRRGPGREGPRQHQSRGLRRRGSTSKSLGAGTRLGKPSIAATGAYAWLVYTDVDTGVITVANNAGVNSDDAGWLAQDIGTTTHRARCDGRRLRRLPGRCGDGVAPSSSPGSTTRTARSRRRSRPTTASTWPDDATTITTDRCLGPVRDGAVGTRSVSRGHSPRACGRRSVRRRRLGLRREPSRPSARPARTRTDTARRSRSRAPSRVGVAWSACTRATCSAGSHVRRQRALARVDEQPRDLEGHRHDRVVHLRQQPADQRLSVRGHDELAGADRHVQHLQRCGQHVTSSSPRSVAASPDARPPRPPAARAPAGVSMSGSTIVGPGP